MKIRHSEKNGIPVIAVEGDINIDTASGLRDAIMRLYEEGTLKLVIDFKDVSYIDSSGLAVLIEMLQIFRQNNGEIALSNMVDKIKYVFEVSKIDMLMSVYKNEEDAVASL